MKTTYIIWFNSSEKCQLIPSLCSSSRFVRRENIRVIALIYNFDDILRLNTYLPNNDKDTFLVIWEKGIKSLWIWRIDLSPWGYGKVAAYISAVFLQNNISSFWSTWLEIVWHHITVFHNIVKQKLTQILQTTTLICGNCTAYNAVL